MTYAEISVLIEGALESDETVNGDGSEQAQRIANELAATADARGFTDWDVYVLVHDHDELREDEECACVQYVTDHHPAFSSDRS